MYMQGVPLNNMRVSNLNHETATAVLFYLQEVEPDTWVALTKRLQGINSAPQLGKSNFNNCPKELPFMFQSWREYRDYLLKNLITDETINKGMSNKFNDMDIKYDTMHMKDDMYRIQIVTILTNDSWLTKVTNWERKPDVHDYRQSKKGRTNRFSSTNKYING